MDVEQADLAARLRSGDEAGFVELMRVHGPRLLRVARRLMPTREEDARDCLQESMVAVACRIGDFRGDSALETWLYRIVVNSCLMKLRKTSTRSEAFIDDLLPAFEEEAGGVDSDGPVPTPYMLLQQKETRQLVHRAIQDLPERYRAVVVLRDIEGRRSAEVAKLLGITPTLVNVRLHRARGALRKLLSPSGPRPSLKRRPPPVQTTADAP